LIENEWIDWPYVIEQTDMPLLVRRDTGKFLRESDLKAGGDAEVFSLWNRNTEKPVATPGSMGLRKKAEGKTLSIRLDGIDPALEGTFTVTLAGGEKVEVTTVYSRLRGERKKYPLDRVGREAGLPWHGIE